MTGGADADGGATSARETGPALLAFDAEALAEPVFSVAEVVAAVVFAEAAFSAAAALAAVVAFLVDEAFLLDEAFLIGAVAFFDVDVDARDFEAAALGSAFPGVVAPAALAAGAVELVVFFAADVLDAVFFTAAALAAAAFASVAFAVSLASARAAAAFFAAAVFAPVVAAVRLAAAAFDAAVVDAAFFAAAVPAAALFVGALLTVFLTAVLLDVPLEAAVFAVVRFGVLAAVFFAVTGVSESAAFPEREVSMRSSPESREAVTGTTVSSARNRSCVVRHTRKAAGSARVGILCITCANDHETATSPA